jgi:putative redox protein
MITAAYVEGDRLRISVRGHETFTDQLVADGGADTAATPTELFIGALAACIGFYGERYLRRHGLDPAGLTVTCGFEWAENPHRVGAIDVNVEAPTLTADRRDAFMRVVERCTIHNTLQAPPAVRIKVAAPGAAVA